MATQATLPTAAQKTPANGHKDEAPAATLNLWQRIRNVQAEADNIPKNGTAPLEMGGFKFVRDTDVSDAARELYTKHGIAYTVTSVEDSTEEAGTTAKGKTMYRTRMLVEIRLRNVDNPDECEVIRWPGFGDDMGDKGLGKAGTSAVKNALTKLLLIGGEPAHDIDATDATGGEGRKGRTDIDPADDFGPCDEPGCAGRLHRKEIKGKAVIECTEHGFVGKDGKRRGGRCTRETDWNPDIPAYAAYRDRNAEPEAMSDTNLIDRAAVRAIELARIAPEDARRVLMAHGWDGEQKRSEFYAGLPRGSVVALLSDINGAIANCAEDIPA